jgi:hypothetical protein
MAQRTKEDIKAEIQRLQDELARIDITDHFVKELTVCPGGTGPQHKWQIEKVERRIDSPHNVWCRPYVINTYEARCYCGASINLKLNR